MGFLLYKAEGFKIKLRFSQYLLPTYILLDLIIVNYVLCFKLYTLPVNSIHDIPTLAISVISFLYVLSIIATKPYRHYRLWNVTTVSTRFIYQQAIFILCLFAIIGAFQIKSPSILDISLALAWSTCLLYLCRITIFLLLQKYRLLGYNYRSVVLLGKDSQTNLLKKFFKENPKSGYRLIGSIQPDNDVSIKENLQKFKEFCFKHNIHELYISAESVPKKLRTKIIDFAEKLFISVRIIPIQMDLPNRVNRGIKIGKVFVIPVTYVPIEKEFNTIIKRSLDIIISAFVILFILSWLIPILAICIKLESKGPVFFIQKRSGINNIPFPCFKLRTMKENKESGLVQAKINDKRITKIGAFLRKTSLDEFPQFINVFLGDMSIVGPRPHMLKHTEEYSKIIDRYMVRHFIKPGITGLSQVKGYRGNTEDPRLMQNRIKLDIFYITKWNLLLDLKIIFLTAYNIFAGEKNAR